MAKKISKKRFNEVKDFFHRKSIYRQLKSLALGFVSGKNKDIKVVFNDAGSNYTDGKTVVVSLFDFAYDLSFAEIFSILKACVGHEVAHVLYSNFKYIKTFNEDASKYLEVNHNVPGRFAKSLTKHLHNSLEDGRIERIHATRYKGILKHFKFLRSVWWENMEVTNECTPYMLWSASILTLATTGMWPKGYEVEGNEEVTELVTSLIPHIHNAVYANDALTLNQEAFEIIKKSGDFLEKCFENELSDEEQEALENFLNELASSLEHSSEEMSDRQMQRIKKELDELDEDEMELPHSSTTVSSAKQQPSDSKDSNDSNGNGEGSSDEGASDTDKTEENSEDGDKGNSSSSASDNEKDDSSQDSSSNSSSQSKDEDKDGNEEGDKKDKTKENEGSGNSDSKQTSDSKEEEGNDKSSSNQSSKQSEEDKQKKKEQMKKDIEDAINKHKDNAKKFMDEVMDELKEDLKRADAEQKRIEDNERKQTVEDDVEIDAGKFCELNGRKYGFEQKYFVASHVAVPSDIKRRARMLRQKIEKLLFVEDHSKAHRYKSGRLNTSKLWRLGIDENDVFYKKENEAKDYCATLLIDVSGSMDSHTETGTRYKDALTAASIIEEALRDVVPFNIILFTTNGMDIVHYTIKGFKGSKFNHCQSFLSEHPHAFEANNDAVSIAIASEKLSKRPEQEKILFVISDGQPAHYGLSGSEGIVYTKESIDNARSKGVKVIGVAIGDESHLERNAESYKTMYGKSLVLTTTNKICSTLARLLETILK